MRPLQDEPGKSAAPSGNVGGSVRDRPLRILLVTARYLPEHGGTEIHTHEVAKRLAACGAQVTVASTASRGPFERESLDGAVRVLRVRSWPPNRDYYLAPSLVGIVRRNRTDLVHCQGYHTLVAPLAMLAALSAGTPYIVTLHSGGHSSRLRRRLRPLQARLLRPLVTRARRVIAVSSFEADIFARRLRMPRSEIVVIPSGVDLPVLPPATPVAGPPLVVSVGRLETFKGHHRVLEALPAIHQVRPGTRLRLAGTGSRERELRRLAHKLGVAEFVEIAPVPADQRIEMAKLLQRANVVAMLSEYESQGLALHEALALGRPLVVSDETALGGVTDQANVRSVTRAASSDVLAATILGLLDAPPVMPRDLPTWDSCVKSLLELYEETLAERR